MIKINSAVYVTCTNDRNGNPRRAWIVSVEGKPDYAFLEGYSGSSALPAKERAEIMKISIHVGVTPKFYNSIAKTAKLQNRVFASWEAYQPIIRSTGGVV
jgi:hypothetical protein